jgi:hypothetical protein
MSQIELISPSSFYYWEKCPLRAVYAKKFKKKQIFPKHPDADLGRIIHAFIEKKEKWSIDSEQAFENRWHLEIGELEEAYRNNAAQRIYLPVKWNSGFYIVKKQLLKKSILAVQKPSKKGPNSLIREQWISDDMDVGGNVDCMIKDKNGKIIEISDFKTGRIFENTNTDPEIKTAYIQQLVLYASVIKSKQGTYPDCYIIDLQGNRYQIDFTEKDATEIYQRAVELKRKINDAISTNRTDELAVTLYENCSFCDFRPHCNAYKTRLINNFENKRVDIFGEVLEIYDSTPLELKIKVEDKILTLKRISTTERIGVGDNIFVYNLFCPDGDSFILYAIKDTLVKADYTNT